MNLSAQLVFDEIFDEFHDTSRLIGILLSEITVNSRGEMDGTEVYLMVVVVTPGIIFS